MAIERFALHAWVYGLSLFALAVVAVIRSRLQKPAGRKKGGIG